MKTENIHALVKSNDAEYDTGTPASIYIPSYAMETLKRRAKELQSACFLVNASHIQDYEWEDGMVELNDDGEETSSSYQFYLRVWKSGSFDLIGISKSNDDARVTARLGSLADAEANIGVSFTLSDGDKKMPVRVAYNGSVVSGEVLIYSETAYGGAQNAPIGVLLTDGKLDVRVWQPEDMGTDPSVVTVIKPYGVYDIETLACGLNEIGSEKDYDQLFRQYGLDSGDIVATAKIDVDGETYDIVVGVVGDQEVYANFAENDDEEDVLVPLDEEGSQKRLRREPKVFMQAKALEGESNQAYLAWSANCWLNIEVLKNGESIGNYGDTFGSVFGSIGECFDAICEADIKSIMTPDVPYMANMDMDGAEYCKLNRRDVEEGCPHCDKTVDLEDVFYAQPCPNCGEMILPCNICPFMDSDNYDPDMCGRCPIESQKDDIGIKRFFLLHRDQRLELMKKLGVEEQNISEAFGACFEHLRDVAPEVVSVFNMIINATAENFEACVFGEGDVWETLNKHADIYPFPQSFDEYNQTWFERNHINVAFVNFLSKAAMNEIIGAMDFTITVNPEHASEAKDHLEDCFRNIYTPGDQPNVFIINSKVEYEAALYDFAESGIEVVK